MNGIKRSDIKRFWKHVDKSGDCWLWMAKRNEKGYGYFKLKGRSVRAQRFVWLISFGPIPLGMMVCHRCDNPSCVNPAHLFLGSCLDNVRDMRLKGRNRLGWAWRIKQGQMSFF